MNTYTNTRPAETMPGVDITIEAHSDGDYVAITWQRSNRDAPPLLLALTRHEILGIAAALTS
ncbi:hypothetical protein [Pseudoclavibacter sp. 8L]|uniref:hypothetical protein n=1 Tax=Pseudoclavibacter sp. 8L TaxID=2653162 RepID=UPI0012F0CB1F|nr:hypothetical protein [Pseudoclavibacter sp. 8L]VXB32022.1 hypothetical protein PSCLAVI8L_130472 [Pseudoclavibacter sp. 8L]